MIDALLEPARWRRSPLRALLWMGATLPLLLPLLAMRLTDEVEWNAEDFGFAAVLVAATATALDQMMCRARNGAYRLAMTVALGGVFLLTWISASVGIIGYDGDPTNLLYIAVLVAGFTGAFVAKLHADGMSRALVAMAVVQSAIAAVAILAGLGQPWSGPLELVVLNGFFVVLFCVAAALFRRAAATTGASS